MAQVTNGATTFPTENKNCFWYWMKYQKQNRTFTSAILTIMGCGFTMSLILFVNGSFFADFFTCQSLFFGGIILSTLSTSVILKMFRKVFFYYLSALLLILSGAFFTSFDYIEFNIDLVKAGSFLSGISFGVSLLTFITHAGEISIKHVRGSLISTAQLCIDIGIFFGILIQNLLTQTELEPSNNFSPIRVIGIIKLFCGILALPAAFFLVYESPIFLLEHNNEQEALKNLTELREEPNSMAYEIQNEFETAKATLRNASSSLINRKDIIPFIKVFICRFAYALGTSVPVNVYIMIYYTIYFGQNMGTTLFTLYIGRVIANILPIFLIDRFLGRKFTLLISFIGSGIFLVIIQSMVSSSGLDLNSDGETIKIAGLLTVFYNIFLGLGASSVSYTYMSEVFNHSSKTFMNGLIIILENAVHLIIIQFSTSLFDIHSANVLIICAGSIQIIVGALSFVLLPETKGLTLSEAQNIR